MRFILGFIGAVFAGVLLIALIGGIKTDISNPPAPLAAAYYFLHFLVILPLVSVFETPLPLPRSISDSVLHGEEAEAAPVGSKPRRSRTATAVAE